MIAKEVYKGLDSFFIKDDMEDDWYKYMVDLDDYIYEDFKQSSMGLMCDFTKEITKVYTAVFPSNKIFQDILDDNVENAMLFLHHASDWDIRNAPQIFSQIKSGYLDEFRKSRISIYCLHVPLDAYSNYSTGVSFTQALGINFEKKFGTYRGAMCGVIGKTDKKTVDELNERVSNVLGHHSKLYNYGDNRIRNGKVALITGGGLDKNFLEEVIEQDINTFITGVTNKELLREAHEFAKENELNIIGGSHYSTEKFACIEMVEYFNDKGIDAVFLSDGYIEEDM